MKAQFACAVSIWLISSALFAVDDSSCKLAFDLSSAKVNTEALKSCALQLGLQPGQKVSVSAASSSDGDPLRNAALAKTRADNTAVALTDLIKGLDVTTESLGVDDAVGRSAIIRAAKIEVAVNPVEETLADAEEEDFEEEEEVEVAVEVDEEPAPLTASLGESDATVSSSVSASSSAKGDKYRVAVRTGSDETWFKRSKNEYYTAPGLDLAYIPQLDNAHLRVEIGALLTTYNEEEDQVMNSLHFAPMVGYQTQGWVAGVRALGGAIRRFSDDRTYGDGGAELRLGREFGKASIFVGAGRTDHLTRLGLDLGILF